MGLFDKKDSLESYIQYLKRNNPLLTIESARSTADIVGEDMTRLIFSKLATKETNPAMFDKRLGFLTYMCLAVVTDPKNSEQKNLFSILINLYFQNINNNLITEKGIFKIANSFSTRNFIVEVYTFLNSLEIIRDIPSKNIETLLGYLEAARQYYVDERALFSSFIELVNNMDPAKLVYGETKDVKEAVERKVLEDKKASGVYDVDQAALNEMDRKITKMGILSERLQTLMATADSHIKALSSAVKEQREALTEARIAEIQMLSDEANKILAGFNAGYLELLEQQKGAVIVERDSLLAELRREVEKEKTKISSVGSVVGQQVSAELRKIQSASSDSIERIENYLTSSEEIKKLIEEAQGNQTFIQSLKALETIGVSGVLPMMHVGDDTRTVKTTNTILDSLVIPEIIIPQDSAPKEGETKINRYFDRTIPFQKRMDELMVKKEKLVKKGEIFHKKFDQILTLIIQGDAPYLWGPSGCGKTYMIQSQLGTLLGLPIVKNGYILYEQDVLGYTNSGTGAYVPSNFYRCFKYGYPIFYDEMDKGISNATSILNSFVSDSEGKSYVFPNGETIKRHPNFRIIGAGNTRGTGKNLTYNTSQKLDESILQRFPSIEVDYDNRIEERILAKYPGWYDFAINFRKAIGSVPSDSGEIVNTVGTFTTRDASFVAKHKDAKSLNDAELIAIAAIGNKEVEYLSKIEKNLDNLNNQDSFTTPEGKILLKQFKDQVKGMRLS